MEDRARTTLEEAKELHLRLSKEMSSEAAFLAALDAEENGEGRSAGTLLRSA